MKPLTREWVEKAEEDDQAAFALWQNASHPWGAVCFHAQQSAEKYLKAWLAEQGVHYPKTHDLELLARLCLPSLGEVEGLMDGLRFLTQFAVEVRYPGMSAEKDDADRCREASSAVRDVVRSALDRTCHYCIDGSVA